MVNSPINWPEKTRELHNHHIDSTIWNEFTFRDDDIILTAAECQAYEDRACEELGSDCAAWLARGSYIG